MCNTLWSFFSCILKPSSTIQSSSQSAALVSAPKQEEKILEINCMSIRPLNLPTQVFVHTNDINSAPTNAP